MTASLTRPAKASGAEAPRAGRIPGEVGIWVFILGDMTIFAILFATYLNGRSAEPGLFDRSQQQLEQNYGVANTVILLFSSLLVAMAVRGVRERRGRPDLYLLGAMICGVAFSALKVVEYVEKAHHGITPETNDFFMYYFILTGLHWFHLVLGLIVLALLVRLGKKPTLDERQRAFVEGGGCFWHMVDLLWIVLFPLLYLVH